MEMIEKLSAERCKPFANGNLQVRLSVDNEDGYASDLFLLHFNYAPNTMKESRIKCRKANDWFLGMYENEIKNINYTKQYFWKGKRKNKEMTIDHVYYFLFDDLLVHFYTADYEVEFLFRKTDAAKVQAIIDGIKKFKLRKVVKTSSISLLINGSSGLETTSMDIARPKLSIEDNYNDDFIPIHQTIFKRLSKENDKGLILLHGKPGTGKTSYIRYLLSKIRKRVIFLPPNMAAAITDPGLMKILIRNSNSIFVIEDAENIVIDRNRSGHSPVSALLNLADGLLSDCLNIQIICSFNTDLSRVDNALMRKGRLIAKYEFKELEIHKAQALSDRLGFHSVIDVPMVLTDIYNQHEAGFSNTILRKAVGFNC